MRPSGPRFESRRGRLCLSRQPLQYTALGTGCAHLLQCLGWLSLPLSRGQFRAHLIGLHGYLGRLQLFPLLFSAAVISDINFCCPFSYPLIFRCRIFRLLNFPVAQFFGCPIFWLANFPAAQFSGNPIFRHPSFPLPFFPFSLPFFSCPFYRCHFCLLPQATVYGSAMKWRTATHLLM